MHKGRILMMAAASLLLPLGNTWAADDEAEIDGIRKELRQVRQELQEMRFLLSELAEMDRQRAQLLTRALEGRMASLGKRDRDVTPPSLPESPPAETKDKEPAERPEKGNKRGGGSAPAPSGGGGGTVTGRVNAPANEPVAYVYVENVAGGSVSGETVTIEQVRKQFAPTWAVIPKGTTVTFPNLDNVYHNVFSRSPGNSFDLGLYSSSEPAKSHTFVNPGPVEVYCNIHPRMASSLLVVPNKLFAKVKADGTYELKNVPAGKRKIVAWAPGSSLGVQWIDLNAGGSAAADFALESRSDTHKNKQGRPYGSYP